MYPIETNYRLESSGTVSVFFTDPSGVHCDVYSSLEDTLKINDEGRVDGVVWPARLDPAQEYMMIKEVMCDDKEIYIYYYVRAPVIGKVLSHSFYIYIYILLHSSTST